MGIWHRKNEISEWTFCRAHQTERSNSPSRSGSDAGRTPFYCSPDGSFIIFDSYSKETENSDLFICFRKDGDTRSEANRFDDSINNETAAAAYLSPDKKYFFFTRFVDNTDTGDIYWVDARIIEELKPEKVIQIEKVKKDI